MTPTDADPADANLADALGHWAAARPFAVALIHGRGCLHYQALDRMVWRSAAGILAAGVRPGQVVAILVGDGLLHLVLSLALARMGAVQISLGLADTPAEHRLLAGRAGATLVLGEPARAVELGLPVVAPRPGWLHQPLGEAPCFDPAIRAPGGARPWIIATSSGTTGDPKLFRISHRQAMRTGRRYLLPAGLGPGARLLSLIGTTFHSGRRVAMTLGSLTTDGAVLFHGRADDIINLDGI